MSRLCAVYGASRGIGRAIAARFHESGYDVAMVSRNVDALEAAAAEIAETNRGGDSSIKAFRCDVTQPEEISRAVAEVRTEFGKPVSVLVTCAGVVRTNLLISAGDDEIREQIETNLVGTINVCRAHIKQLIRAKNGAIVCIGSTAGALGLPGTSVYAATKSALIGFSRNLAAELASRDVTVNVVAPGMTETDMTSSLDEEVVGMIPLRRMARPEEVARLVRHVAEARYMTGQTVYLDGGMTTAR